MIPPTGLSLKSDDVIRDATSASTPRCFAHCVKSSTAPAKAAELTVSFDKVPALLQEEQSRATPGNSLDPSLMTAIADHMNLK